MSICESCQRQIVSFYLFSLKTRRAQEFYKHCEVNSNPEEETEDEDSLVLNTLDIVKRFTQKFPIKSILEDEELHRLIIERNSSSPNDVKQEPDESQDSEMTIFHSIPELHVEKVDNDDSDDYNALDDLIEEEPPKFEQLDESDVEAAPGDEDDQAETDRFVLDNIEFVKRTPEYLVNAYKPSEKASRPKDPDNWIRNRQRNARVRGEEYMTNSGKVIPAKRMQSPCKVTCRFKCRTRISDEDRQRSFDEYWGLANFILQRKFIFEHHKTLPVQRRRFRSAQGKPREYSSHYFLDKRNADGTVEKVHVCESMFLKTFDICRNIVSYLHKKVQTGKVQDLRGISRRKLSPGHELAIEQIKANPFYHIEHPMSITKMFELYQQECHEKQIQPVKDHTYRKLFTENNECEFLKRDKVICEVCDSYYRSTDEGKKLLHGKYNEHIQSNEKCMSRAKQRMRSARKVVRRKEEKILLEQQKQMQAAVDDMIVEEHLTYEDDDIDYS